MSRTAREASFVGSLLSVDLFKKNQGRLARMWTWIALVMLVVWGAWTLYGRIFIDFGQQWQASAEAGEPVGWLGSMWLPVLRAVGFDTVRVGIPILVALIGAWAAFRFVQFPRFADFLIEVEAEMMKVSWPQWTELWRATVVVLITMFLFAVVLFSYDLAWQALLQWLTILKA